MTELSFERERFLYDRHLEGPSCLIVADAPKGNGVNSPYGTLIMDRNNSGEPGTKRLPKTNHIWFFHACPNHTLIQSAAIAWC